MFGSHLSIAKSLVNALDQAASLGLDTVQIFTKNQQQWKAKPLDPGVIKAWRTRTDELGWGGRTVSHASYLINLASPNDELWQKSIDLMYDEIERCETLGVKFLVHHPGAYTSSSPEEGMTRIANAYRELFTRTRGYATVSCLENTVGSGTNLGRTFEELAHLREMIVSTTGAAERVGFCIDTCHAHAGGYDLSSKAGAGRVVDEMVGVLGATSIRVLHLNDSKGAVGSRLDRHEHVGKGTIGLEGFRVVVNRAEFADKPKILETPKDDPEDGVPWDTVNLGALKSLIQGTKRANVGKSVRGGKIGYPAPATRGRKPRTGA